MKNKKKNNIIDFPTSPSKLERQVEAILFAAAEPLDTETIDLLIDFINMHNGSALISSHDIDFLKKTCQNFFIFDGTNTVRMFSDRPRMSKLAKKGHATGNTK